MGNMLREIAHALPMLLLIFLIVDGISGFRVSSAAAGAAKGARAGQRAFRDAELAKTQAGQKKLARMQRARAERAAIWDGAKTGWQESGERTRGRGKEWARAGADRVTGAAGTVRKKFARYPEDEPGDPQPNPQPNPQQDPQSTAQTDPAVEPKPATADDEKPSLRARLLTRPGQECTWSNDVLGLPINGNSCGRPVVPGGVLCAEHERKLAEEYEPQGDGTYAPRKDTEPALADPPYGRPDLRPVPDADKTTPAAGGGSTTTAGGTNPMTTTTVAAADINDAPSALLAIEEHVEGLTELIHRLKIIDLQCYDTPDDLIQALQSFQDAHEKELRPLVDAAVGTSHDQAGVYREGGAVAASA